ncbi:MAG: hypothetical protein LCH77_05130 [Actinobacteria bacterium]|uniref:hypothetical protein n=1 Tax=Nostocoides veronense TaxID=330836 RepID=UPI0031DFA720|nr:hypothetical protein [Actinomycetota bacterium]
MPNLLYLESMDSVRSSWGSSERRDQAAAQVAVEALLAFAFGNRLVVQQSYALDSYAFQKVLKPISQAYEEVHSSSNMWATGRPAPVQLHLHRARTFLDVVANTIERATTATSDGGYFYSSLYPELNARERHGDFQVAVRKIADSGSLNAFRNLIDDYDRRELIDILDKWFGPAHVENAELVVTPKEKPYHSIDDMLMGLYRDDSRVMTELNKHEVLGSESSKHIIQAVRRLRTAAPGQKLPNDRSLYYGDRAWTADGRTALDVLKSEADLDAVREMVNTLYNRIVVRSIGTSDAFYTTDLGSKDPERDALAQSLALSASAHVLGPSARAQRNHELTIFPASVTFQAPGDAAVAFWRQFEGNAKSAFAKVFEMADDQEWRRSLHNVKGAVMLGDMGALEDATAAHVALLADGLAGILAPGPGGGVQFASGLAGVAGGLAVNPIVPVIAQVSGGWTTGLGILSATLSIGGVVSPRAWRALQRQWAANALKKSLGEFVTAEEG